MSQIVPVNANLLSRPQREQYNAMAGQLAQTEYCTPETLNNICNAILQNDQQYINQACVWLGVQNGLQIRQTQAQVSELYNRLGHIEQQQMATYQAIGQLAQQQQKNQGALFSYTRVNIQSNYAGGNIDQSCHSTDNSDRSRFTCISSDDHSDNYDSGWSTYWVAWILIATMTGLLIMNKITDPAYQYQPSTEQRQ